MKAFSIIILFLIAGLFTMNLYSCQSPSRSGDSNSKDTIPTTFSSSAEAAKSGIEVLKALVTNKNLKGTFSLTEAEVNQLTTGTGMPVQELSFNKLITLNADSSNVAAALDVSSGMIYPLQISDRVLATAAITGSGNKWKLTDAGQSGFNGLFDMQKQLLKDSIQSGGNTIIKIPSLSLNCIAAKGPNGTVYLPDNSLPGTRITKGQAMNEREFSKEIIAYAKQFYEKNRKAIEARKFVD
jgi:hypothetical protein